MSVGYETIYGDVLVTKTRNKPPTWDLEKANAEGKVDKCRLFKTSSRDRRGWLLHMGRDAIKYFRTRRQAVNFFSRLVAVPDDAPHTADGADLDRPDEAIVSPEHHAELSEAARTFSHNDVDEDGAIIDIDTEGNRMEYGNE